MSSYFDWLATQKGGLGSGTYQMGTNPAAPIAITPGYANATGQGPINYAATMANWGQTPAPAAAPVATPNMIGADYEQMPQYMTKGNLVTNPLTNTGGERSWWDTIVGTRENPGMGNLAIAGFNSILGSYVGLQQLALAKEALANSKNQFALNFANQAKTTNTAMEDRQRARVASNAGAYQSVGDYMNEHRVNGVV